MAENLQKTAYASLSLRELSIPHHGILTPAIFSAMYELHCYEPSEQLRPFIEHIWVQRLRKQAGSSVELPEVYTGPNFYLFLSNDTATIHGVQSVRFKYEAPRSRVWAGAKFKPGAFHAFWPQSACTLFDKTMSAGAVFPEFLDLPGSWLSDLNQLDDRAIVDRIEHTLLSSHPVYEPAVKQIARILAELTPDTICTPLPTITTRLHISERSVQQLFREYVGVPLKWVVMRQQLLLAIGQVTSVREVGRSYTEIAAECGYSSQSHFVRAFKAAVGMTPSTYRRLLRDTR